MSQAGTLFYLITGDISAPNMFCVFDIYLHEQYVCKREMETDRVTDKNSQTMKRISMKRKT